MSIWPTEMPAVCTRDFSNRPEASWNSAQTVIALFAPVALAGRADQEVADRSHDQHQRADGDRRPAAPHAGASGCRRATRPDVSTNSRSAGCAAGQHLLRRAADDDLAAGEHRDAVADPEGRRHVVRDDDRGHAELVGGAADHLVDVLGRDRIEARGRLVVEQDLGPVDERARQARRACAARPTARRGTSARCPATFGQVEPSQQIAHALHDLVARQVVALEQRERDVLDDVHRVEQRRVLEHHAELAAQASHLDVAERHDVLAVDPDLPASGLSSPMRCFISTDFPCPEPPMMMLVLPRSMSRSMPRRTCCGPKVLFSPRTRICQRSSRCARRRRPALDAAGGRALGVGRAAVHDLVRPEDVEDVDEEVVEHEDRDRACDHGARRGKADLLGAAADVEALVAGGQRQRDAEHRRLDAADDVVLRIGPVA